jgi:hypothetical protein
MLELSSMRSPARWEALYHQLGQIISDEPMIPSGDMRGSSEVLRWLGRAGALIEMASGLADRVKFDSLRTSLLATTTADPEPQMRHIRVLLYAALAKAELSAPSAAKGAFIPAGNSFDALTAITGILRECTGSVLIVDPYLDAVALTDFLPTVAEGLPLRLLASEKQRKHGLPEAVERWIGQFAQTRPLELRLTKPQLLHDRLIMDSERVWSLSQSLNAIAQRSPAMVQRVSAEIANLKREAFTEMWESAVPVSGGRLTTYGCRVCDPARRRH